MQHKELQHKMAENDQKTQEAMATKDKMAAQFDQLDTARQDAEEAHKEVLPY